MLAALTQSNKASCNNKQKDLIGTGVSLTLPQQPKRKTTYHHPHSLDKTDQDRVQVLRKQTLHKQLLSVGDNQEQQGRY